MTDNTLPHPTPATAAAACRDPGRVRLGGLGPAFGRSARPAGPAGGNDAGPRPGRRPPPSPAPASAPAEPGASRAFAAAACRDPGRVRLGGLGPAFGRSARPGAARPR